ncbi:hypothetical protein AXG93_3789s1150 [Marchantia polymorpha subsp. ruderalis]|uniref:Uncharacterized protein n=1 Tax=Marchantia polymorpha subsp. ruderalis TaxID=1480154 RepID=A0A176WEN2_MARPO|nr:hypothetical protein AXG93_3789s1150 [Marchantia polymorpha subsp. ruderalis]
MAPAHAGCPSMLPSSSGASESQGRNGAESEDMSQQDTWGLSHPVLRPIRVGRTSAAQTSSSAGADFRADDSPSLLLSDTFSSSGEEENCGSDGCETPKAKRHRIPETTGYPPAPRKPRATSRRRVKPSSFFSPPDFDSFLPYHSTSLSTSDLDPCYGLQT